jgi:hypothetical protein
MAYRLETLIWAVNLRKQLGASLDYGTLSRLPKPPVRV